ncbi:MAG: helix-turn-helix transcriptional regulator [Clostridia bacterium]|jgi:transcriptional regulator with XRE-family HTH domain|nr:helix-turn-helix transcriptional regulator [Clostridia bacterium]
MEKNGAKREGIITKNRELKNFTVRQMAKQINLSAIYLLEIEQGLKVPSDYTIRQISNFLDIPDEELFSCFGKEPILTGAALEGKTLKKTIGEVQRSKLNEDRKQEMYDKLYNLYRHIEER